MRKVFVGIVLGFILAFTHACNAGQIDLGSLLADMLDRSKIAEFPEPEFLCKQVSSYNRRAKTPGNSDWFANDDSSYFIGSEKIDGREEWIMMDVDGPGVVVRWWITQYKYDGTIRVYLDGSDEPVLQATGDKLIGPDGIAGPPLNAVRSSGRNLYLPIPFNKHCKITYDGANKEKTRKFADCLYYNINYLQYPKGTDMKTFTMADLKANAELIDKVQSQLLLPKKNRLDVERKIKGGKTVLSSGQSIATDVDGGSAISSLRVKVTGDDIRQTMRSTVISISFDGKQRVWVPVGGFFGTGPGLNAFKGWWRQVEKDGWMNCWWPMPFKNNASVRITNNGNSDVTVELADIGIANWTWTDRTMYFHSTWRGEDQIDVFGSDESKMRDWNYVTIDGKGVYAGDTMSVFNRPRKGRTGPWWGEGDEKIFVDGESFPSHFGTGTEDYFGYAWGSAKFFEAPFHAQPYAAANKGIGHTTNTRVRSLDKIPFTSSLNFNMELAHWQTTKIDYASTCYWYAFDGAKSNGQASPEKVRSKVGVIAANVVSPGIAKKQKHFSPPMGWNSYTGYSIAATADELKKNIDVLAEKLLPYGYNTVTVDNGWFLSGQGKGVTMALDKYGRPDSHEHFFPGGIEKTIDYAHKKGVKFGIWLLRGINRRAVEENLPVKGTKYRMKDIVNMKSRCGWAAKPWWNYGVDMTKPGAQEYYDGLIQKYADMGVDFIKFDDIVPNPTEVEAVVKAIAKCDRKIILSLSPGDHINAEHTGAYKKANMVRITSDIWDNRGSLNTTFKRWEAMQNYDGAETGSFLDMDMVCFGRLYVTRNGGRDCKFTEDQKRTFMVQRALAASPLMLGGVLYSMDDFSMSLFTHPDILKCNQNGVIGKLAHRDGKIDVWKTLEYDNEKNGWIGIFNRDGTAKMSVDKSIEELGLEAGADYMLKDIWTAKTLPVSQKHTFEIPADGVVFLKYEQTK